MMNMMVLGFVWSVFLCGDHATARLLAGAAAGRFKAFSELGNCLTLPSANRISSKDQTLPIDTTFKLPAPTPVWPPELKFKNRNKPIVYSALHGHAFYPKAGLHLQGTDTTAEGNVIVDMGVGYEVISAKYLGSEIAESPWLNYFRKWGPKKSYDIAEGLEKVKWLPGKLKKLL